MGPFNTFIADSMYFVKLIPFNKEFVNKFFDLKPV